MSMLMDLLAIDFHAKILSVTPVSETEILVVIQAGKGIQCHHTHTPLECNKFTLSEDSVGKFAVFEEGIIVNVVDTIETPSLENADKPKRTKKIASASFPEKTMAQFSK